MSKRARLLLLTHAAATWFMTGAIWFVQIVHYPLLVWVGPDAFAAYERANIARTASVVGPVMLLEALTALLLLWRRPPQVHASQAALGICLLVIIWGSTWYLQFPIHKALTQGFDPSLADRLSSTNWVRTAGWSARALLVVRMLLRDSKA